MRKEINNISCVGSGTIGAGWIARLLVNKIKVKVYDLTPFQETRLKIVIENTKSAYKNLFPNKKSTCMHQSNFVTFLCGYLRERPKAISGCLLFEQ